MPAATQRGAASQLKGVGAGGGTVRGIARVITAPADFGRLQEGEILVAAITTPAWTPLFAVAAGVVTDIGGPLSHSSIVAREYGIPAVLGTGSGTRRIRDGQWIVVDGSAGVVRLEDGEADASAVPAPRRIRPVVVATAAAAMAGPPSISGKSVGLMMTTFSPLYRLDASIALARPLAVNGNLPIL